MKYFVYKVTTNNGDHFGRTNGTDLVSVMKNIEDFEKATTDKIKIKEVPVTMFSFPSDQLWKLYNKTYEVKMINRRAIKVLGYQPHGVRVKYVDTGQECTVHASVIRKFTPKPKTKK